MDLYYETSYRLRTNDFDCYDTIIPSSILDSYQDIAGIHAYMLNFGFDEMFNKGYFWVILRQKVKVLKSPTPGSVLTVSTWPLPKDRLTFKREYKIHDQNGDLISYSSSVWVLINVSDRRVSRAKDIEYVGKFRDEEFFPDLSKIEDITDFDNSYLYDVQFSDLDHNKHMNNSRYLDVLLNILNFKKKTLIEEFQLDYVHEVTLGQKLEIKEKVLDNYHYFFIYRDDILVTKAKLLIKEEDRNE